ncbi:hypothetical protein K458DRAFT_384618 [Lentithecium fluviatile CBS 122367]|uniref:Uncharacterized protein n=1 Tax=Lentithecium fluviatile CBS 122367 TaxID=1168545 RepID=A0A6G1JCZ2_9PLEO|nr:hypothetical protein K458DRAFT_384618 [Lentithecium fluviatile CBS 122367]
MFATAGAKRVGRGELQSPASSVRSSPDPTITALLRARAHDEFAFTTTEDDNGKYGGDIPADEDEEVELMLFAGPSATSQTHKIRLTSPDAGSGEPGILVKKPRSYYFADEVTSEQEEELQSAAITAEEVLEMGKLPWPGCALPWKVTTLTAAGMKKEVLVGHDPVKLVAVEEKERKRKRKGKKTRIALRKKAEAAQEKEAEKAKLAAEKEEAGREKRTRRNREKKAKKKAREKAKKLGDGTTEEPDQEKMEGVE